MKSDKLLTLKQEKLKLLEEKARLKRELPHLYGWKNYKWQREFLESTNRMCLLTAANQIGKSSVQIRKVIDWATNTKIWPSLWRTTPRVFWYLYPSKEVATAEFDDKWVPDFMPRGSMKSHPVYGWREQRDNRRQIVSVTFNSGVTIYFKTYAQDSQNLQTATVHYIACDEELPIDIYDELTFRINGTDGYYSMVFTATLGQEAWRLTMEAGPTEVEKFPHAFKIQVSLFDCKYFEDGTESHWTEEKIHRTIAMCSDDNEVLRRVYGRFVVSKGRKYSSFSRANNVCPAREIPFGWNYYAGVDIGAGGENNHPSTISFIAVSPDFTLGYVFKHWRGDEELTTMSDVANKYIEMRGDIPVNSCYYDYHARDFKTITDRMGLSFEKAEKGQEIGESTLNTLFKNTMLFIFDIPECQPIIQEFISIQSNADKRHLKDDSVDSVRYGVTKIPWAWDKKQLSLQNYKTPVKILSPIEQALVDRNKDRARMFENRYNNDYELSIEKEIAEYNGYIDEF